MGARRAIGGRSHGARGALARHSWAAGGAGRSCSARAALEERLLSHGVRVAIDFASRSQGARGANVENDEALARRWRVVRGTCARRSCSARDEFEGRMHGARGATRGRSQRFTTCLPCAVERWTDSRKVLAGLTRAAVVDTASSN